MSRSDDFLTRDAHFTHLGEHLRHIDGTIHEVYRHFTTLASAVIGGAFALGLTIQTGIGWIMIGSSAVLFAIGISSFVIIWAFEMSWARYRKRQSDWFPETKGDTDPTAEHAMKIMLTITCGLCLVGALVGGVGIGVGWNKFPAEIADKPKSEVSH